MTRTRRTWIRDVVNRFRIIALQLLEEALHVSAAYQRQATWDRKQRAAYPGRYYGGDGTLHDNVELDVELFNGQVVAVWFRCQVLPFVQEEVSQARADEVQGLYLNRTALGKITGVEIMDPRSDYQENPDGDEA